MKILVPVLLSFVFANTAVAADIELLQAKDWAVPKKATTLLQIPAIYISMEKLQADMSSTLKIKYPGGDEGTLWANELQSWLIALGLSSSRIEILPGSKRSSTIELEVIFQN